MSELFVRKNIKYRASSAILCRAGSELGNTMHGHHDFQLSDDVLHKVHIGHYTFYSKAIIRNPKFMIRAPGVFVRGYVSGENIGNYEPITTTSGSLSALKDVAYFKFDDANNLTSVADTDERNALPDRTLFGDDQSDYYIRGTCYNKKSGNDGKVTRKTINPYGFGEHAYPGCKHAREGRGVALAPVSRTVESMI